MARSLLATLAATVVLSLLLAGCTSSSEPAPTSSDSEHNHMGKHTVDVHMTGNKFVNASVLIHVGDSVRWTHEDGPAVPHTVTSDSGAPEAFDSNPNCAAPVAASPVCMGSGDQYEHLFAKAGTYAYHCKIHSAMKGNVTVVA